MPTAIWAEENENGEMVDAEETLTVIVNYVRTGSILTVTPTEDFNSDFTNEMFAFMSEYAYKDGKLRDLAMALKGSGKQFEVTWDNGRKAVNIVSGSQYTPVGGELSQSGAGAAGAALSTAALYMDGQKKDFAAYNINGNNYYKLRDIAEEVDFGVGWDAGSQTVTIDTVYAVQ